MDFNRTYEQYNKDEYCKRLINLNASLKYHSKKFVKSRKKNKRLKALTHAKRVLAYEEYKSYLLFYQYFKIDKRLHILNANKELLKYDCSNLYFLSHYYGKDLKKYYDDFNTSKYKVGSSDMFGEIMLLILKKRS